jgi:EpsI family protein
VALLAGTLAAAKLSDRRRPQPLVHPLDTIPNVIAGWTGMSGAELPGDVQGVLKATSFLSRVYQRGGHSIELFVAFYAEQRAGESMHSPQVCLPSNGWEIGEYGSEQVPVEGKRVKINRYVVQKGLERMTVLYWYQSRSGIIANEYLGKALLIKDALLEGTAAGSIVRLTFTDRPGAIPEAVGLASQIIPEVRNCFGG